MFAPWRVGCQSAGDSVDALSPYDPVSNRAHFLPEQHVQLGTMFLHMAHVVQKQLRKRKFHPFKVAQSLGCFVGQCLNCHLAFFRP